MKEKFLTKWLKHLPVQDEKDDFQKDVENPLSSEQQRIERLRQDYERNR